MIHPDVLAEAMVLLKAGVRQRPDAVALVEWVVNAADTGRSSSVLVDYEASTVLVTWLASRLPVDDPVRGALPRALDRLRVALAGSTGSLRLDFEPPGLGPSPALEEFPYANRDDVVRYELTPSRLRGADDPVLRLFPDSLEVRTIAWLLSDACTEHVEWTPPTGLPAGAFAQDPRLTARSTVDAVAATLGVETDAAAYYLQVLALPDPTNRNVARWCGWSARRVKTLAATLVAAGVVVTAKRERAERSVFLPGGWLSLRAPSLPLEAWKAPLYGLRADGTPVLSALVALMPVPSLFTRAWQRVQDGDEPRLASPG
jgi:hypothetical protein